VELAIVGVLKEQPFNVDVYHGVSDVSVSEEIFDVEDVSRFLVEHCAFPAAHAFQGELSYESVWVLGVKFQRYNQSICRMDFPAPSFVL